MDLDELQNMISIIGQKKTKCRGNLRLKVLLKLTHDHVRRSWIDGQHGNPEKLLTILRNTHMHRDVVDHETDHEEPMDVDQSLKNDFPQEVQCSNVAFLDRETISSIKKENKPNDKTIHRMGSSVQSEKFEVFKDKNNYDNGNRILSKKNIKLQKALERLLKECDCVGSENDSENSQVHHRKVKKIRKLLTQCKIYLRTDSENQNAGQQLRSGKLLKTIKKLLKEYQDVLEINVYDTELNVLCLKSHYKLKKLSKKLKKYKNHGKR